MSFKFTPEDFEAQFHCYPIEKFSLVCQAAADLANAKLAKHLEGLPVVYGEHRQDISGFSTVTRDGATHTARLWDITPIQPEKVDSTTKFLHDWIACCEAWGPKEMVERAKALLKAKENE